MDNIEGRLVLQYINKKQYLLEEQDDLLLERLLREASHRFSK